MPADCEVCKPGDATLHASAVASTGCETSYELMDACMKRHNGRVSACQQQWERFRACYEAGKVFKKTQQKAAAP